MFLAMIKKEIKQLLRTRKTLVTMFVFPIVLITTLSLGLKNMMSSGDIFGSGEKYSKVYYTIDDEKYKEGFFHFKEAIEGSVNIKFDETSSLDEVKDEVDQYDALVYIDVKSDGFDIYSSKNGESMKTKIFRSIFESLLNEYAVYDTVGQYNPKAFEKFVENKYDEYVVKKDVGGVRDITSAEYYTFAELALIILYVATMISESVYKEKQLTTINRIRLSKTKETALVGAKVLVGIIIAILQTALVYVYSSFVLDVNWGEHTLKFISMFLAFGIFASVIGAIAGILAKNDTTAAGILNAITIVTCFLGGAYTPVSTLVGMAGVNKLMYLSPIYWINTAISSLLCGIESNAYIIALAVPLGLSTVCLIMYFGVLRNKGGIVND
ncbi:ABC transporter permease [Clostridium cellulovorans]|uniref:ABC-2 type transporter n=1 Tax=Clostridium cellulovorans (strain ATCC 35296 / DSM 3052 / OCM 3 / 743B) TaxID=573061 RepID=D9SS41_CLOC7|nr:ABC transporter permease [Clostridium cellulovorans]ADL52488.1 ABC-2 type transporter [Clostridium cellulovorans 743B]